MSYPPAETEAYIAAEEPYDSSDKASVNAARKKAARLERERLEFTKSIMETPQGRAWMLDLLSACKIMGNPVVQGDTHFTYYHLGEQNIGKKLMQDIDNAAPEEYILMMKEAREKK